MTIDEAIEQFKYDAEYNRADLDLSYAEENEQVAEWLEELKCYRNDNDFSEYADRLYKRAYDRAYNKAIDDFVKFANTMPTVEEDDGTIRPMWLEEMAEQLKEGEGIGTDNQ